MDLDEEDLHVCLSCQATIIGLDNYVHHRKVSCPARGVLRKPGSSPTQSTHLGVAVAVSVEQQGFLGHVGSHSKTRNGLSSPSGYASTAVHHVSSQPAVQAYSELHPGTTWSQNSMLPNFPSQPRPQLPLSSPSSGCTEDGTVYSKSASSQGRNSGISNSIVSFTSPIKTSSSTFAMSVSSPSQPAVSGVPTTHTLSTNFPTNVQSMGTAFEARGTHGSQSLCPVSTVASSLPDHSQSPAESATLSLASLIKQIGSSETLFEPPDATDEMAINISFPGRLPFKPDATTQVSPWGLCNEEYLSKTQISWNPLSP